MLHRYMAVVAAALLPALAFAQGLAPDAAVAEARAHVDRNQIRYGVTSSEVADLAVTNAYNSRGLAHVYFRQTVDGLPTIGTEFGVHFDRNGNVFHSAGAFTTGLETLPHATAPTIGASAAALITAQDAGLAPTGAFTVVEQFGGPTQRVILSTAGVAIDPVTAELAYVLVGGAPVLSWVVNLYEASTLHNWYTFVDASTGAVIARNDLVNHDQFGEPTTMALEQAQAEVGPWLFAQEAPLVAAENAARPMVGSYRVYAMPTETPNHGPRTLEANPDVAGGIASPFGWHDTNGAAGAEFTITRGNNVHAYLDAVGNGSPDAGADVDGGAGLAFDFPIDLTLQPATYRPAVITNLFYWNNVFHDVTYQYGFDDPSGNFQVNNYGRGGLGNDDVQAEAQDGSVGPCENINGCFNNANFGTPVDGSRPRMQMYLWNGGTPMRDGDLDAGIIMHEYSHGISNRLTGGPSVVNCLQNSEQMGEGWGDWFGVMLTMRAGDTRTTNRGVGTYALFQATTGPGIRPAPYNTNFAANNYTYQRTRTAAVPHGVGFVWATILWEVAWDLIDAHGFSANFYDANGTAGNQIAMNLVMEGMKLQPCSPGFVDGRNAILAADVSLYGGVHTDLLWTAFARRGLGFGASQGSSGSNADNTEAFNTPESIPPAGVTNLAVVPNGDYVNLTFTATGDDGPTGTATAYDIRYSTTGPITNDTQFNAATQATGEPAPQAAGASESIVVTGLNFTTTYHFALKVLDENANLSPLSNPASGTTLGPPVLAPLAQTSVTVNMPTAGTTTVPFALSNTGPSGLRYNVGLAEAPRPGPSVAPEAAIETDAARTHPEETAEKEAASAPGAEQFLGSGGPDAFGYRWVDSDEPGGPVYNWVDISTTGTSVTLSDDGETNLTLPFQFEYYGVSSNLIRLGSNGGILFGATAGDVPVTNELMPSTVTPNAIIAPFWDDLNPAVSGNIYYQDMGDGRFVITWNALPHYATTGTGTYTFQLILQAGGAITFQYKTMVGPTLDSATIGIENQTASTGLQVVRNANYVHDNLAIRIAALWVDAVPASGTINAGSSGSFNLVFDATGMAPGTYHANMTLTTNDPSHVTTVVPITLNIGVVANEAPAAFEGTHLLTAVSPNPFSTSASFTLAVRDPQAVRIEVYDALGRRVATLLDGEMAAGAARTFTLNGAALSSGTYVLRVEGDAFSETRRVTLAH